MGAIKKKKRRTVHRFKEWLNKQKPDRCFKAGSSGCPLSRWEHQSMDLTVLDRLPRWASRFAGAWDEQWQPDDLESRTTIRALQILDKVT